MSLFQFNIDSVLKEAITKKAHEYGVSASSLVRIALVNSFLKTDDCSSDEEYEEAVRDLTGAISQTYRNRKLPSIEDQLKDL